VSSRVWADFSTNAGFASASKRLASAISRRGLRGTLCAAQTTVSGKRAAAMRVS